MGCHNGFCLCQDRVCLLRDQAGPGLNADADGTGIIGGFVAWIMATLLLGSKAVAWFFIPPFLVSTIGGSIIAGLLLKGGLLKQFSGSKADK